MTRPEPTPAEAARIWQDFHAAAVNNRPWTEHDGSGCPYEPGDSVDVKFSDGRKVVRHPASSHAAEMWNWTARNHSAHIVEHRRAR